MKRGRYTYHEGKAIDITDDNRPTCWGTDDKLPFRPVQNTWDEFFVYLARIISLPLLISSSIPYEHRKAFRAILAIIEEFLKDRDTPVFLNYSGKYTQGETREDYRKEGKD